MKAKGGLTSCPFPHRYNTSTVRCPPNRSGRLLHTFSICNGIRKITYCARRIFAHATTSHLNAQISVCLDTQYCGGVAEEIQSRERRVSG